MTEQIILKYVKGTLEYNIIMYGKREDCRLTSHTDLGCAKSVDDRKSTIGYVFSLSYIYNFLVE
jgi:hypothetical protein